MASVTGTFLHSIRNAMEPTLDPSLVDNTPRLLDMLNRSDRLARLLVRRDARGYTLLHLAAEKNQPESLKCLLIKEGKWRLERVGGFDLKSWTLGEVLLRILRGHGYSI